MFSLLPLLSVIVPLFIGVLCLFTSIVREFVNLFSIKLAKISLLLGGCLTLITVLAMVPYVVTGETLESPLLYFRVDQKNMAAIVVVAIIFVLVSIYNTSAEKGGRLQPGLYNFFLLLLLCCWLGLLLSYDLFGIFLFIELVLGVSIILVVHNPSKLSTEAAFKYLIVTGISALFVLLGTLIVFILVGDSNILLITSNPELQRRLINNPQFLMLAIACFIIGVGADIGLVPFHGWLPDVFPGSTITVNGFSCAEPIPLILTLYKLVEPFYRIYPSNTIVVLMLSVGLISMLFGTLLAYSQRDFFRMLAYCSIDEFGHAVFALGLLTSPMSFVAGQYYLINSALMKTGMVLSLGSVFFRTGVSNMNLLGGLLGKMNRTALSYIITAFSLVGVPPLSGFYAKWLLFNTVYQFMLPLGGILASVLALLFLVFMPMATSIYLIRSFHKIFMGQSPENIRVDEVHFTMWLPTIVLAAIAILVGFQPNLLLNLISTG